MALAGSLAESKATQKAMAMALEVVNASRRRMYCAELFEKPEWGKEIRPNGLRSWLLSKEREAADQANESITKQNACHVRSGIKRAGLTFVQQCAAYGFLISRVLAGSLSVGSMTMCISAVASFFDAMRHMLDRLTEIKAYDFYYDQLDEYLHVPQTLRQGRRRIQPGEKHCLALHDVSFRYPGSKTWALRHVSLELRPGERLALVGENGSGKTTLIKLLCRLYDPTEGSITLDGIDIRMYDYDGYQALFAAVFQDFRLFDFSLRENIALGGAYKDAEILDACLRVGLADMLAALPKGLDTRVGRGFDESGFEPSGGQAQKIALARALVKNAPFIMLDEPTAALDARAEYELYRGFDQLVDQKTTVYISHRMSSSRFCDHIAVLHKGNLCEYGTHQSLMEKNGLYARLYRLQARYYAPEPPASPTPSALGKRPH